MADDKKLKLKEVTQDDVFTPQTAKKANTGLTYYVCLNNQVKQLLLYTLEKELDIILPTKTCSKLVAKSL